MAGLYQAAAAFIRLSSEQRGMGRRVIDPARIRLWSKYGPLSRKSDHQSMQDLDFGLDPREPLDIFVQTQGPRPNASLGQVSESFDPAQHWRLDVSLRGISALITSLQILIKEIDRKNIGIDSVLNALLRITRFPPVLLAFVHLREDGVEAPASMEHLHLLVEVFDVLCRSMVPEWICATETSRLEGARQVVSWMHSLCVAAESEQNRSAGIPRHVHRAQTTIIEPYSRSSRTGDQLFSESAMIDLGSGRSCIAQLETRIPSRVWCYPPLCILTQQKYGIHTHCRL